MKRTAAPVLVALALACAPDDPFDPADFEVPGPTPTLLAVASGNSQMGGAGAELGMPLRVRVVDQFGDPVPGVPVTFGVVSGGGAIFPQSTVTNDDGFASAEWTLGATLGVQQAQATTTPATTVARFTATAVAGSPASIQLGNDTLRFDALGDTARVGVTASDEFGNAIAIPSVSWTSDNPNRATVNGAGLVTATGNGTTRVIASSGDAADTVVVVVAQTAADLVLEPAVDTLIGTETTTALHARVFDGNGRRMTAAAVTWSSTNEAVATVSNAGVVTAVGAGIATIIATHATVADSTSVVVRVPASISITPAADTLAHVGDTLRLGATVTDANGAAISGAPVVWASLDTLIARVDRYGRVTARDTGNARIVATSGGFADTAIVSVAPPTTAPRNAFLEADAPAPLPSAYDDAQPVRETRRVAARRIVSRHARSGGRSI